MFNIHFVFLAAWILFVGIAFLLRRNVSKIADMAIKEKTLRTGIYRFFPIEGERAVEVATGYKAGIRIVFWFSLLFLPFLYIISIIQGVF